MEGNVGNGNGPIRERGMVREQNVVGARCEGTGVPDI